MSPVEIITLVERRRYWSAEQDCCISVLKVYLDQYKNVESFEAVIKDEEHIFEQAGFSEHANAQVLVFFKLNFKKETILFVNKYQLE